MFMQYNKMINVKGVFISIALLLVSKLAIAAPITYLEFTGGVTSLTTNTLTPGAFASVAVDGFTYSGSAPAAGDSTEANFAPTSIMTLDLGGNAALAIYTAGADGVDSGFAAPSGDITGSTLTLDLSAWTVSIFPASEGMNAGSSSDLLPDIFCDNAVVPRCNTPITTIYDATTGAFTANWTSYIRSGALPGAEITWNVTGYASVVPVPAAVWLFSSGLIGLVGFARRRKN